MVKFIIQKNLEKILKKITLVLIGHSDTEILLKSYIYYGYDVVKHLNGIFAFAIWDTNKKELFIARDHFGIKPLFYTYKNNNFIFSSEIKAILEHPEINLALDETRDMRIIWNWPCSYSRTYSI